MVFSTQPPLNIGFQLPSLNCYQLFTEGNEMYENLDEEKINYCAPEILERPKLGLIDIAERGDEYQFNNFAHLLLEIQMLSSPRVKLALVLIFQPD